MLGIIVTLMLDRGRHADEAQFRREMNEGFAQLREEMRSGFVEAEPRFSADPEGREETSKLA